jgi:hypothetical protein
MEVDGDFDVCPPVNKISDVGSLRLRKSAWPSVVILAGIRLARGTDFIVAEFESVVSVEVDSDILVATFGLRRVGMAVFFHIRKVFCLAIDVCALLVSVPVDNRDEKNGCISELIDGLEVIMNILEKKFDHRVNGH